MQSARFSIVTPSFNQGRYIRDCIESVQQQDGPGFEHLVVDGGSTDTTLDVLREYPHLDWVSEPDEGQTDAINKGFRRATGEWVMWLNADDYLLPGALQRVADFGDANPGADVIYGDCYFVDDAKTILREKREPDFDAEMLLFYGCFIPSTATFLRRNLIRDGWLPDPAYKVCMDYEYYLRLADGGYTFGHLPAPLACFRWHDANVSSVHASRRYQERLQIQRQYLAKTGRCQLGREWLLKLMFRLYQLKRLIRRQMRPVSS